MYELYELYEQESRIKYKTKQTNKNWLLYLLFFLKFSPRCERKRYDDYFGLENRKSEEAIWRCCLARRNCYNLHNLNC